MSTGFFLSIHINASTPNVKVRNDDQRVRRGEEWEPIKILSKNLPIFQNQSEATTSTYTPRSLGPISDKMI